MKLARLQIRNYRGIGSLNLKFHPDITILIGRNGVGKSSLLDAIASVLPTIQAAWLTEIDPPRLKNITIPARDRKIGHDDASISLEVTLENPAQLPDSSKYLSLSQNFKDSALEQTSQSVRDFWFFVQRGGLKDEDRPLMVYYRQDRAFDHESHRSSSSSIQQVLDSSLQGNLQAISHLQLWWDKRDADEARRVRDQDRYYRDPQLESVRTIIKEVDGFEGISFDSTSTPDGLYFQKEGGVSIHVDMLSSGEKSFIILIADLARRLQILHPDRPLSEIPGIVLIDEVELNLHPSWQSKIVSTLTRVFAKCQFVISTHSPQVISSVDSDNVIVMSYNSNGVVDVSKPLRTKGQTSNYLLEGVFGSSERFPEIDDMIENFNLAISYRNLDKAKFLLDRIENEIEGDPPELLVFRKRLSKLMSEL